MKAECLNILSKQWFQQGPLFALEELGAIYPKFYVRITTSYNLSDSKIKVYREYLDPRVQKELTKWGTDLKGFPF